MLRIFNNSSNGCQMRNRRDQRALFERAQALMRELNAAMNELDRLS